MWCWYYDKRELRHTQSIQQGLSVEQEIQYRREGARFILQIGNKMGLRYETMATGVVYYHRFYMVHTFQEFPRHVTACCCLFLAGKVEETPKKCKDIMKTAKSLIDEETWAEFGPDPREEVMTLERILLQTIKFDFIVEHPYPYLLKFAKCLKGDKKKLHNMVQMAWTFVNDSLCTTLSLQWEPEIIAIALMYLAGKLSKFEVTDWSGRTSKHQRWWDIYVHGISMDLLEDICHQVLDLYSPKQTDGGGAIGGSSSSSGGGNINMALFTGDTPVTGAVPGTRRTSDSVPSTPTGPPPAKKAKKEEVYSDPGKLAVDGAIRSWMKQEAANTGPGKQTVQNAIQHWMQKEGSDPVSDVVSQQAIPKFPLIAKGSHFQVTTSPVKVPEVVSTVPAVPAAGNHAASASSSSSYSYPYPYPNYASGPHNYPPPSAAPPASSSGPPPRYPAPHPTYNYPPTSSTQVPPPQGPPQGPPPQQIPPSYQQPSGPPARQGYGVPPPTGGSSSGGPGPVPQYSRQPSAPASHQYPSSGHSSGSGYHQPPGSASHYPSGPPAPSSQAPPGSHYPPPSHGSSSSSYYPQPPNASQGQPPPYQQSESRSSYPSSYGHAGHSGHSSSRPYYPPS